MNKTYDKELIIALPKGRILKEVFPILQKSGICPDEKIFDENSRKLKFSTSFGDISIIMVRSFDVVNFVAFGGAHIGIVGKDVILEFNYKDIYAPIDLRIGLCRMSIAEPINSKRSKDSDASSHIRVATKYPEITKNYFAKKGIQAECIKLNGSLELAPSLGMCEVIVDLVSTGMTLKENGLVERDKIIDVSSKLIVNRIAAKTNSLKINNIIKRVRGAIDD